ncbi:DUF4190 domain-containing protein [Phycisphaerales bacterium]|nr:DUF4190 domain-containing protein [bacterium]MDC0429532.1 DUF4190 domain-containing protein [Phycisphaerales bacterium]
MKPDRSTLLLVLGILSVIVCAPIGIAAFVMGRSDLREIDAGDRDPQGRGMTQAGMICGIVGMVVFALQIFFVAVGLLLPAMAAA